MQQSNSGVIAGGRWRGVCVWGVNGDGRRSDLGGEHTMQGTDDVLWNCAPETCVILLTSATWINSIKKDK